MFLEKLQGLLRVYVYMPCPTYNLEDIPSYLKKIIKQIEMSNDDRLKDEVCKLKSPKPQKPPGSECPVPVFDSVDKKIGIFPFCWHFIEDDNPKRDLLIGPGTHCPIKMTLKDVTAFYWNTVEHAKAGLSWRDTWCRACANPPECQCPGGSNFLKFTAKNIKRCKSKCKEENLPIGRLKTDPEHYDYIRKGVPSKKNLVFYKPLFFNTENTTVLHEPGCEPPYRPDIIQTGVGAFGGAFGEYTAYENACAQTGLDVKNYYILEGNTYYFYPSFSLGMASYFEYYSTINLNLYNSDIFGTYCLNPCEPEVGGTNINININGTIHPISIYKVIPKILFEGECKGGPCTPGGFNLKWDLEMIMDEENYGDV